MILTRRVETLQVSQLHHQSSISLIDPHLVNFHRPSPNITKKSPNTGYSPLKIIGQGTFGIVYTARTPKGHTVAIKKVPQDPHYKNREESIMKELKHRNIIKYIDSFKTKGRTEGEFYLNIVMEHMPMSLYHFTMSYRKKKKYVPILFIKLFAYQMFTGLAYLHSLGIVHRDLKPENVLVDPIVGNCKICDFGSAKKMNKEEKSVSYIASRYYRAPELILGSQYYDEKVDLWAAACTISEVLLAGNPIFSGDSSEDQFIEIVRLLGKPTIEDLKSFHHSVYLKIPRLKKRRWDSVFPRHVPEDIIDLLRQILVYNPSKRPSAAECLKHRCFDELFDDELVLPSGKVFYGITRTQC